MAKWDLEIDSSLSKELRKTLLRKPYVKKEPFIIIYIHDFEISDFVNDFIKENLIIEINTAKEEIICKSVDKKN